MLKHSLAWLTLLVATLFSSQTSAQSFVVANRGDGTITVHAACDGTLLRTVALPPGSSASEPMYVVQHWDEVLVGDRGNSRVVRFDKHDYSVRGTIDVGAGVFHMWSNGRRMWVNNDIDNTVSVIDLRRMRVVRTVPMPADLVAQGYKPHDVFVGKHAAYVSFVAGSGATDFIVKFHTRSYRETHRAAVGKDPHVWWDRHTNRLFSPAQNGNQVEVLNGRDLSSMQVLPLNGAHGVFLPPFTRTLLVTGLTGGGVDDLSASKISHGHLAPPVQVSTGIPTAHNIAATVFGRRIAVTHSGATATKVSLYEMHGGLFGTPSLTRIGDFDAGLNPFGLAVVY